MIVPVFADGRDTGPTGSPGEYEIMFFFRLEDDAGDPRNVSFETDKHDGSSLLAIANPALKFNDPRFDVPDTRLKLHVAAGDGNNVEAFGFPNEAGVLSDVRARLIADSFAEARKRANLLLDSMISALSFSSDIPLIISRIVVREVATEVVQRSFIVPFPISATGVQPHAQSPEARVLFNRYHAALNSNDPNWRFLCFASIVEQLWKKTRVDKNVQVDLEGIRIPIVADELVVWFLSAFPKSHEIESRICLDMIPNEARGMTTNDVIVNYIRPLRTAIAHSLLEDGTLSSERDDVKHLDQVRTWSPLLRCITRLHLRAVYGPPDIHAKH